MSLRTLIAGSYGAADNIFAGHPFDAARAREALVQAGKDGIGFAEYLKMHEEYLQGRGCDKEHIEAQLEKVKQLDRYFDYD